MTIEKDNGIAEPIRVPANPDSLVVRLAGKQRVLTFDANAFMLAQLKWNVRITFTSLSDPSIGDIPIWLWIGLLNEFPDISVGRVGNWFSDGVENKTLDVKELLPKLLAAMSRVMGMTEEDLILSKEEIEEMELDSTKTVEDVLAAGNPIRQR